MKLTRAEVLYAVRKYNEEKQEDKDALREQLQREMEEFLSNGGKVQEIPEGVTTDAQGVYGYGVMGTLLRGSNSY